MKSKAPLVMMEQIVMVLVFALAAALCLRTFVLSGKISQMTENKNRAVLEVQNAAENMKHGDAVGTTYFSKEWEIVQEETFAEYIMTVSYAETSNLPVWQAEIVLMTAEGEELARIPVAGQTEVEKNE